MPWGKRWYAAILPKLEEYGVKFVEKVIEE
jgi:hypothetical protein